MGLTVLPNRGVLHTSRDGTVRYTDVGRQHQGRADPPGVHARRGGPAEHQGRPELRHQPVGVRLLRAPAVHARPATLRRPARRRSSPRSTASTGWPGSPCDADFTLDPASAVTILDVPTSRGQCCHVGGDIDFDAAGNLYLSTGDDTNPFDSGGYTPIDERADRNPAFDAQRTVGQQQRPARQGAADQAGRGRRLHHPGGQHVRARARPTPGPRSTRWASATRSG